MPQGTVDLFGQSSLGFSPYHSLTANAVHIKILCELSRPIEFGFRIVVSPFLWQVIHGSLRFCRDRFRRDVWSDWLLLWGRATWCQTRWAGLSICVARVLSVSSSANDTRSAGSVVHEPSGISFASSFVSVPISFLRPHPLFECDIVVFEQ